MTLYEVEPWWRTFLLLILISCGALLNMKLKSIKLVIKPMCKLTRTFHWIVSQQKESKVTSWECTLLRIMDRNINFNIEFMQIKCIFGIQ